MLRFAQVLRLVRHSFFSCGNSVTNRFLATLALAPRLRFTVCTLRVLPLAILFAGPLPRLRRDQQCLDLVPYLQ